VVGTIQGGHSPGKPGKPGIVREFKSGQGKKEKSGKICSCMWPLTAHIVLDTKCARSSLLGIVKNIVVIVMTVYMSISVRNNMHFVLYRDCCEGRYSVNFDLKCLEKSGKSQGIWS